MRDCPCLLSVETDATRARLRLWHKSVLQVELEMPEEAFDRGRFRTGIDRGVYVFTVHKGESVTEYGRECDSLYAWSSICEIDAGKDTLTIRPELGKQFLTLYIEVTGTAGFEGDIEVSADCSSLELSSLSAVGGEYLCRVRYDGECPAIVRIPRQRSEGGSLSVRLLSDGAALMEADISGLLSGAGYDWNAVNLSDMQLRIDSDSRQFSVKVLEWERGMDKKIVL